ncbi:MAG: hypothetical protein VKM92_03395 [Cyanobacteriota bacterium]|nr:hypothetical protein [Cyanobacteriota bacterium]
MTSFDAGSAGVISAVSGLSSMVATAGTDYFVTRAHAAFNLSGAIGTPNVIPSLILSSLNVGGSGSSSTVGASFVGSNTGTERLQVSAEIDERVTNRPSSAQVTPSLESQLSAF